MEECPLINVQEVMQLGDHHSGTPHEITVSGKRPPWTLNHEMRVDGGQDVHMEPQHYPHRPLEP